MSFEVRLSKRATETFNDIITQLNQRWGNKFVRKFKAKVSNSLDIIAESPFIYPIAQKDTELRKCVLHKNCSMFYSIHENFIEVDYFWDNRQEPIITF